MQHRDEDSEPNAAEQAFEALRAEVTAIRQAMKSFPEVIKKSLPVDTTETLGKIAQQLETIGHFMAAIEEHPGIRLTPAQYTQAIAAAGEGLMQKSVRELDSAKAAAGAERRELAAMIGTLRGRSKQWEWLGWTGAAALILGLLISPVVARVLPFGWDGQVAAYIMNADRWQAGAALMAAESPEAWRIWSSAAELQKSNAAALTACREAAVKTKKEQRCSVVVTAP
jgi:hypothetical protein